MLTRIAQAGNIANLRAGAQLVAPASVWAQGGTAFLTDPQFYFPVLFFFVGLVIVTGTTLAEITPIVIVAVPPAG